MIELLRTRRSIRKYLDKKIDPEKIDILKEALLRSPSSRSIRPWQFYFVDDRELLVKLAQSKEHGSSFLKNATLGIVVCGDEEQADTWIEDCCIASIIAHFTAHSLGLGSCWIQIRNRKHNESIMAEQYIQELLNIPKNLKIESIIAVGYPDEVKKGVPKETLDYSKIH
jgi:nitroreductase